MSIPWKSFLISAVVSFLFGLGLFAIFLFIKATMTYFGK